MLMNEYVGLGFASPNIIDHEHNISHVGLQGVRQLFNDLLNVSRDKPCFEISTRLPSKAFIASAYSIEVLSLGFLLASVTLILKMGYILADE